MKSQRIRWLKMLSLLFTITLSANADPVSEITPKIAQDIFSSLRIGTMLSNHCFADAELWTYFAKRDFNVTLGKAFIFFSKRSRSRVDFRWRYHVVPYARMNGQIVMFDKTEFEEPVIYSSWVVYHDGTKLGCKVVSGGYASDYDLENHNYCRVRFVEDATVVFPNTILAHDSGVYKIGSIKYGEDLIQSCIDAEWYDQNKERCKIALGF